MEKMMKRHSLLAFLWVSLIFSHSNAHAENDMISLSGFFNKGSSSQERITAWTVHVKLSNDCEWTLQQGTKSTLPKKFSQEECADLKKLVIGLKGELGSGSNEESKSTSHLNYEIEYLGKKHPVSFQAPRRCKIDSQGNEVDCVNYQLSPVQKLLNIMRLKAPKSRHY